MDRRNSQNGPSTFHTSSSFSSLSSSASSQISNMPPLQTSFNDTSSTSVNSAPLPSPTAFHHSFGALHPQSASTMPSHPQQQRQAQQPQQQFLAPPQQDQQYQQQPQQQRQNPFQGQRAGNGGAPETTPFLQDFTLLAEAAKRAEMACLMRDMEGCEL
ncbi:MAG: hypothetical protein M1820_004217 [Bogoriella megaspora]|nr:MAG: hypothetical protein M1820_004217 [Bogoriella megaspora]